MAIIKCPECGNDVSNKAFICPHCGYSVSSHNIKDEQDSDDIYTSESYDKEPNYNNKKNNRNKTLQLSPGTISIIILSVIALACYGIFLLSNQCKYEGCSNQKYPGCNYCEDHICREPGCKRAIEDNSEYCSMHNPLNNEYNYKMANKICLDSTCNKPQVEGGKYCEKHTCTFVGCYERVYYNTTHCRKHQF